MRQKIDVLYVIAVAFLSGLNKTQEEIAGDLGISQSLVSRLIHRAKNEGKLEVKTRFAREKVTDEDFARAKAKIREGPLRQTLMQIGALAPGKPAPTFHVYPHQGRHTSDSSWRHRIGMFCKDCAGDLLEVLLSASVIGVAWGEMVASAVDAMQLGAQAEPRPRHQSDLTVFPLLGEPLGRNISQHSSSVLASKLAEILDPEYKPGKTLSLAPVPALIPMEMEGVELGAIWKLIRKITAFQAIYGADDEGESNSEEKSVPLIKRVDAILTSISTQERPLGFDDDRLIRTADIRRDRLNELVIGDLCGVVIRRPNLDRTANDEIDRIEERWTGVKLADLEACAARAQNGSDGGAPGNIVLAIGANKASVVHEALRRGLIQHLFMDEDLADRLGEICAMSSHSS